MDMKVIIWKPYPEIRLSLTIKKLKESKDFKWILLLLQKNREIALPLRDVPQL